MKKFFLLTIASLMTVFAMAIGRNDGSTKANAIDFDWDNGIEHVSGTKWYRVDLAPLYEEENPSLTLYLTNPSNVVGSSVDVSMQATVAGQTETGDYTIAARQYKTYTANASMLVRMKQTEIYLTLTSNGRIKLSAKVFEAADLDETCKDARTLAWNTVATQNPMYSAWWKVSLTPIKQTTGFDAKITITNTGSKTVNLKVGQSLDCPSSGLTKRTYELAPGESVEDTVPRSMITSIQPDELYFGIENVESQISIKVEKVAQPPVPIISATEPAVNLHVTDTLVIPAGRTLYKISVADMDSLNKYEPEFTYRNEGSTDANMTVKMAFERPAFGTSNTDYALAAGEEEIVVYKKNMLEGMGGVDSIYLLTITDQPINFYGRFKHVREGKACKTNIDYNWTSGHTQEARTTQWYAIDLTTAKANLKDVVVYVNNQGAATATVKASMAFSCPYIDLQEITRTVAAGDTIHRRMAYSTYAMMSDTVWIGLETNQDLRFWAVMVDAEKQAVVDTICEQAVDFNWEDGVLHHGGDTVWYRIDMTQVRDLAAKFPTVFVQNLSSTAAANITAELSLECPDSIANESRSKTIAANESYSKQLSRNMFENIKQDTIYLKVYSTEDISLQIRLTEEAEGASCASAIPFNWVSGNTQAANQNLWYAVDLREVMQQGNDIRLYVENRDNATCKGVVQLSYDCPVMSVPSTENFTFAPKEVKDFTVQNTVWDMLEDSVVYINVQSTTSMRIWAELLAVQPFDTIYPDGLTFIPLMWDSLYTQDVDTAWYIIPQSEIEKIRNLDEKVKPVGHLYNIGTVTGKIRGEAAFGFPIVKNMMESTLELTPGEHYADTIPAGTFDQFLKKDSIIIRVTRPQGKGTFQFKAELVKAFSGNSRNDALPIRMDQRYTQSPNTEMWYKINTADLKKDKNLYNKALYVMTKNAGQGAAKVKVAVYDGMLSEVDLFEEYGLDNYRERTIPKGEHRAHNIPAQAVYGLGDAELYIKVRTTDSLVFETRFTGTYAPMTPDPKQKEAVFVVPNVDYIIPGDNQEHWYMFCLPYLQNNYIYADSSSLTYEVTGKVTVEGTATFQDEMDCQMPVRKRTFNSAGKTYKGKKLLSELFNRAVKKAGYTFDISSFQSQFIDSLLHRFVTKDSVTFYVRVKTDKDIKVRLNTPQMTGDQCVNPMDFDWEHGNVNPAGANTWVFVKLDSLIVPDTCDLRLHVDNWAADSVHIGADLYFDCNDPATISKNFQQGASGRDSIDIDRDFLQQLGWADMIINYTSDQASHIWAELIPNAPREYDYDTIRAFVCQGGDYTDTITGNVIDPVDYTMQWNDTVSWKDGVTIRDSVTTFIIRPLVTPEVITVDSMKKLNAAPLLVQGMQLNVEASNAALTAYYKNLGTAVDTIITVDTVYWAEPVYKANGDLNEKKENPLDLTSFYGKDQLTDTLLFVLKGGCGIEYRKDVVFPLEAYKYGAKNDTLCPPVPAKNPDTLSYSFTVVDTLGLPRYVDTIVTYFARVQPTLYTETEILLKPVVMNDLAIDTLYTLSSLKQQFEDDATDLTMKVTDAKWQVQVGTDWQDMPYTVSHTATTIVMRYVITTECGDVLPSGNVNFSLTPTCDNDTVKMTTPIVSCGTYHWTMDDQDYPASGTYYYDDGPISTGSACNRYYELKLIVNYPSTGDTTATNCGTFIWYENVCDHTGDYLHTFPGANAQGCDSIVTLHFTLYDAAAVTAPAVEGCESYYWAAADTTILTSGNYTHKFQTIHGCDSVVTLPVTIHHATATIAPSIADCDLYYWAAADTTILTSGTYTHKFATVHGCDSVVTMTVTIYPSAITLAPAVSNCESYYWAAADTTITTSGNYTHKFQTIHGCDSIVTLPVTIYNGVTTTATAVEGCESYYWAEADTTILASGNYTHVFATTHGCDSVVTLPVTIHHGVATTATAVEGCESYYWAAADTTILATGNYTHVFATTHGCDSVVTLPVTIHHAAATTEAAVESCDSYYWAAADTTITTTGNYTHKFQTIHGCDSVVTLPVTIHKSVTTTAPAVAECNLYYWAEADTTVTTTGTYTHVFNTTHGCDSVVTVDVTITTPYVTTLSLVHKFGDRLIMINRNEINAMPGWNLDSLDTEHPEYVTWYEIDPSGNERVCGQGYYYNLPNGEPLPTGYTYYAVVNIPANGVSCGAQGTTVHYTIPAHTAAPALVPSLARPGENINVLNLDPTVETTIRIYTAEGMLLSTYTVQGESTYSIQAARENGFYLVELSNDSMKSTLRYIVK